MASLRGTATLYKLSWVWRLRKSHLDLDVRFREQHVSRENGINKDPRMG